MNWNEFIKKITDKHLRETVKNLTKYILILAIIFIAYIFLANYVLQRSEEIIGFTGVYNYSFEMRDNNIRIRFNTLDPMASLIKFQSADDTTIVATKDYRRFHEHITVLKPDHIYTMTIDLKSQESHKFTYKTDKIETRNIGITGITIS